MRRTEQEQGARNRRTGRRALVALLATTALTGVSAAMPGMAFAQEVIDGTDETVNTTGGGSGNGTKSSSWVIAGGLIVGSTLPGSSLAVSDGGVVANTYGVIGADPGAEGLVTVDGVGSEWINTDGLVIGQEGIGTLEITNGGQVSSASGGIALNAGATGDVTVDGAGSLFDISGSLNVGYADEGTLTITNGGEVRSGSDAYIGTVSSGVGKVTVDGAGSLLSATSQDLYVGYGGDGTLEISNGGEVEAGYVGIADDDAGAAGLVTVDGPGSLLSASSYFYVGLYGSGTLEITNGGEVDANGPEAVVGYVAGSDSLVTVDGAGSLFSVLDDLTIGNEGKGTLHVTNGGEVEGGNRVFIGDSSSGVGSVTVDGVGSVLSSSDEIYVGANGVGTLTISNGGVVASDIDTIVLAQYALTSGTLNIGAASGDTAQGAGTLDSTSLTLGDGSAEIVFNHTDTDYDFDAAISGAGQISQIEGVTKLTGDSSGFSGTTAISGGSLYVNGLLGGAISSSGGTLGGSGTVGSLTLGSGATLAPGNSVGTFNAASADFTAGSIDEVELNDGGFVAGTNNDLLDATGAVLIDSGASIHVMAENGTDTGSTYAAGTYTIISGGSVTGTFGSISDDFAFLDFADSYDPTTVYLTSTIVTSGFCLPGYSANECAAGDGVFSLGSGSLYTSVLNLSTAEAPGALDQLSGEIHASMQTALIEDSRFPREAAMERLRISLNGLATDRAAQPGSALATAMRCGGRPSARTAVGRVTATPPTSSGRSGVC